MAASLSLDALNALLKENLPLRSSTWMQIAFRYYGLKEIPGVNSDPRIIQFFATTRGQSFQGTRSDSSKGPRSDSSIFEVSGKTVLDPMTLLGIPFKGIDDSSTSWCSAFVNHVMISSGYLGTNSDRARSWENWGQAMRVEDVKFGAIAVFERGNDGSSGHVGFYVGKLGSDYLIYGGNQSDCVKVERASYLGVTLIGFRWPDV